jgi:CubicO group peptidase (beta-lactamase class C family)
MGLVQGTTTEQFSELRDRLEASIERGDDIGASIAVYLKGELVCDLWGGFRDEAKTVPWDQNTLVNVWSTTKTMTFLVMLMLADRGQLDFGAPVYTYWPEFGVNGKRDIMVHHVMNHAAGLSGWTEPLSDEDLANWDLCVKGLAEQAPWWDDRTKSGYHALTQGFLIGEIVRRITGTSIGQFFKSEVADVLGADFFIGLPEAEEDRVSLVIPSEPLDIDPSMVNPICYRTLTSPRIVASAPHHRWWRAAEIPAANGHGNAKSVALIQQVIANNGHAEGHRFFKESTGEKIFQERVSGVDEVLGMDMRFGLGYGLASSSVPLGPRSAYWGGFGGSMIITDQDLELTFAYMMNKMHRGLVGDTRGAELAALAAVAAMS